MKVNGVDGVYFAVWAPNALRVVWWGILITGTAENVPDESSSGLWDF